MNTDYSIVYINDRRRLGALCERLGEAPALALDIETACWWDRQAERVSLIQLAYREGGRLRVAVVDALAEFDPAVLRRPLGSAGPTKAIHNAAYDAVRLERHFNIRPTPIHDTMLAARRVGERPYSLKAQAESHLGLRLDKGAQQSDWGARPLNPRQLGYAALDAAATLLLYEHQMVRGLRGDYRPRGGAREGQGALPLDAAPPGGSQAEALTAAVDPLPERDALSETSLALLGIIAELPSRYGPEQLAASVGEDRVGLAGWIIDGVLGEEADVDEETARSEIAGLCERGLVRVTPTRRLEASAEGKGVWLRQKPR
jgi:3'-5' exonuclease